MNTKTRIATLALGAMLLGSNAWADHGGRANGAQYDYAKVISAEPIVNYVTVTTPVRECWEEMQYYTVDRGREVRGGGALIGAVIGGVIGHQFGSGRGSDAARERHGYVTERHARPVERCETRYREHREERVDGYRVLYRYRGQKYMTEMPYDPGNRLRVRVDIRPAG